MTEPIRQEIKDALLRRGLAMVRIIWAAIMGSVIIFGVVLTQLPTEDRGGGDLGFMVTAIYAVALSDEVIAHNAILLEANDDTP